MKQVTENRGIPYATLKDAKRNGTGIKKYKVKQILEL